MTFKVYNEILTCPTCSNPFQKTSNMSKYCSKECKFGTTECLICGQMFQRTWAKQKKCDDCLEGIFDGIFYPTPNRKPPKFTFILKSQCLMCKEPTPAGKRRAGTWLPFCSTKCHDKFRRGFHVANKICTMCGKRDAEPSKTKCVQCNSKHHANPTEYKYTAFVQSQGEPRKEYHERLNRREINKERMLNLHAIGLHAKPPPAWYNTPLDESAIPRDAEGNEIEQPAGQVEWIGSTVFTPRELLAKGLSKRRILKQWMGQL